MKNASTEMVRYGVTVTDIQNLLQCSEKTVRNELCGVTEFSFPEAEKIRNEFFPSFPYKY